MSGTNPSSSSSSSASSGLGASGGGSVAQWIVQWHEINESATPAARAEMLKSMYTFFTSKGHENLVKQLSYDEAREILVDLLRVRYRTAEIKGNRAIRVETVRSAVVELVDSGEQFEEEDENAQEEEQGEQEEEELQQSAGGTPTKLRSSKDEAREISDVRSPIRPRRERRAKTIAADRQIAEHDQEVINSFSRRVNRMKAPAGVGDNVSKTKHKGARKSARRPVTPDPSDDSSSGPSTSDSDSDSAGSSSSDGFTSPDDESSSDSDNRVRVKGDKKLSKGRIKTLKQKQGSKLAEYIWGKSHGHVKRACIAFPCTRSKRNEKELWVLGSIFDSLMRSGKVRLYEKSMRLLALRISALQSYEITGSWDVADQFGEDSVQNGLLSRKQLSKAAKSAERIKKISSRVAAPPKDKPRHPRDDRDPAAASRSLPGGYGPYRPPAARPQGSANTNTEGSTAPGGAGLGAK